MKEYLNSRKLLIKVKDYPHEEKIEYLLYIDLSNHKKINVDEIPKKIKKTLKKIGLLEGYEVEDKRLDFAFGASSFGQDVIVFVYKAVCGGITWDFIKNILSWGKQKISKELSKHQNIEEANHIAKDLIKKHTKKPIREYVINFYQNGMIIEIKRKNAK
jgi:hypothetical protein